MSSPPGGPGVERDEAAWLGAADRRALRGLVTELRASLAGRAGTAWGKATATGPESGDLERQLAALGLRADRAPLSPVELGLDDAGTDARRRIAERLGQLAGKGLDWAGCVAAYLREAAEGWANRLLALRCLESRGLCDEAIVQRQAYGNRSLCHHRLLARRPELGHSEDGGLLATLRDAFENAARHLPGIFDPASPAMALSPSPAALARCVALLSVGVEPSGTQRSTDPLFRAPDALGWSFQYWHGEHRRVLLERMRTERAIKLDGPRLLAATQLYTEPYMVRFLVHNSLGALWPELVPEDPTPPALASQVVGVTRPPVRVRSLETLRVLDPACGSGHFLLEAFDLLVAMHERAGRLLGTEAVVRHVLEHNLAGLDLDPRAVQIAQAALWMRAAERCSLPAGLQMQIQATDQTLPSETELAGWAAQAGATTEVLGAALRLTRAVAQAAELGSLATVEPALVDAARIVRASALAPRCATLLELVALLAEPVDVLLGNPPYVDKRDYGPVLRRHVRARFGDAAGNLYAAFLLRALAWEPAAVAMVTPQTFMFLRSYGRLRARLAARLAVGVLAQLGTGAFADAGVDAAMYVLWRVAEETERREHRGTYLRLVDCPDKPAALGAALLPCASGAPSARRYRRSYADMAAIPGGAWLYAIGDKRLELFRRHPPLRACADVVLGMKTSHNDRFVRAWWEIAGTDAARRAAGWVPYEKDVSGRRFVTGVGQLVRWTRAAVEHYRHAYSAQLPNERYWFRRGLAYGLVSRDFTAKLLPAGAMADMAASCVFPHDPNDELRLLGLLNSTVARKLLGLLNPTVNFQPNDLLRLPVPASDEAADAPLERATARALAAANALARLDPTDADFSPAPLGAGQEAVSAAPSSPLAARGAARGGYEVTLHQALVELERAAAARYGVVLEDWSDPRAPCANRPGGDERRHAAELVDVAVLKVLGHRWPREPAAADEPTADVARDGIVALVRGCAGPSLVERVRALFVRELGPSGAAALERELGERLGRPLEGWLRQGWFSDHVARFRRRPLAWQLTSRPASGPTRHRATFGCVLLATAMDADTVPKLRTELLAPLRARVSRERALASGTPSQGVAEARQRELDELDARLALLVERGFACPELESVVAAEPLDGWTARAQGLARPASRGELACWEQRYAPNQHDGIRVNAAPLERAGLLAARVLRPADAERAVADRARWRAEERRWCRDGLADAPSWWRVGSTSV